MLKKGEKDEVAKGAEGASVLWLAANPFICRADSRWWGGAGGGGGPIGQEPIHKKRLRPPLSLNPTCLAILSHASSLIGLFLLLIDPCIAVVYYQKKNLMFSTPVIVSFISSHWDTQADKGVLPHWSFRDIEPPPHSSP